jgi:hypothetical protein
MNCVSFFFDKNATGCVLVIFRKGKPMMLQMPVPTLRGFAINLFDKIRAKAQLHGLFSRNEKLAAFAAYAPILKQSRRYLGTQEIQLGQIVGSVNRNDDFDQDFRPLRKHLRERWVNVYMSAENGAWTPIRVYKLGEQYFVEDGHHRVSVANTLGMSLILADVWEYASNPARLDDPRTCSLACKVQQNALPASWCD